MRILALAAIPIGILAGHAAPAYATCDGCCELEATLAGWSADGRSFAVIERSDGGDGGEALTLHTPDTTRVWFAYRESPDGADPLCVDATPRLPGRAGRDARRIDVTSWKPLRRHQLAPVDDDWRHAFALAIDVVAVGTRRFAHDPLHLGVSENDECKAWEIRDHGGRLLATLPRDCRGGGSTLSTLDVVGGYLHEGGDVALLKLELHHIGLSTSQRFVTVEL